MLGVDNSEGINVDLQELAFDFLDALEIYQPPEFWKTRMQRFFAYYCDSLSFSHFVKTKLLNSSDLNNSKNIIVEYFEKVPTDRYKKI